MNNIFTYVPKRGDIWLRKISTKEDCFIKLETLDMASVDTSLYEVLGVVAHVDKNGILVVYKENEAKAFFTRCWWYLSGYTLDGTEHTGTLSARFSTNNWAANIDKTITYQADNIEDFVAALNAVFVTDADFSADDWEASVIDGKIRLTANASSQSFAYTTAKDGFVLSDSAPEVKSNIVMLRKNGAYLSSGTISNFEKVKQSLTSDTNYNIPTSPITSLLSQNTPVTLPVYLGTSKYTTGDMCYYMRSVYGDGEEGWLKYLKSFEPVINTQLGIFAEETGKEITSLISKMRYNSPKIQDGTFSPMCDYATSIATSTISAGELHAPSVKQLYLIMKDIKYGTSSDVNADVLNKALYLIGGKAIMNNTNWWSGCRFNSNNGWFFYGKYGLLDLNILFNSFGVVPVLHLQVAKPKLNI